MHKCVLKKATAILAAAAVMVSSISVIKADYEAGEELGWSFVGEVENTILVDNHLLALSYDSNIVINRDFNQTIYVHVKNNSD